MAYTFSITTVPGLQLPGLLSLSDPAHPTAMLQAARTQHLMSSVQTGDRLRILLVRCNSFNDPLLLDEEARAIRLALEQRAVLIELRDLGAVRFEDLVKEMRIFKPHCVHFMGHGDPGGLVFHDGRVVIQQLVNLFTSFKCTFIFLNSCNGGYLASELFATANIPLVIAADAGVPDRCAQKFAAQLWAALADGSNVHDAFVAAKLITPETVHYHVWSREAEPLLPHQPYPEYPQAPQSPAIAHPEAPPSYVQVIHEQPNQQPSQPQPQLPQPSHLGWLLDLAHRVCLFD